MKRLQTPQKLVYEKFYVHEKNLRTRNCRRRFIKNLLPEKRKENIYTNNRDLNRDWIITYCNVRTGYLGAKSYFSRSTV